MNYFDDRRTLTPENYARMILKKLNITQFPINVIEIIQNLGIYYSETDFNDVQKIIGRLDRKNEKMLITVNKNIEYQERKTFTAAHELGHASIPGHDSPSYRCGSRNISLYNTELNYENEANRFASELLMPEVNFKEFIKRKDFDHESISKVCEEFGTSLIATILRYIEFSIDPYAIVVSEKNQILWSKKTYQFRYDIHPKGKKLSPNTYAADFFTGTELKKTFDMVEPQAWLSSSGLPKDFELNEQAIGFQNLGLVLSLLKYEKKGEDEEDE